MGLLNTILNQYEQAITRLADVLDQEKSEFMRDSSIHRFEFTFDLAWKSIKAFLEEQHGVICKSPKGCIREAFKQNLIDYDDYWIDLTDLRNEIAHTYKETVAEKVYAQLPQALNYFKRLLEVIKSHSLNTKF